MTYININALNIEIEKAETPIMTFETWANENDLDFLITELEAMDGNIHLGTHRVQMYWNYNQLYTTYDNGPIEALIALAKEIAGRSFQIGDTTIKAPMKFKGI